MADELSPELERALQAFAVQVQKSMSEIRLIQQRQARILPPSGPWDRRSPFPSSWADPGEPWRAG